MFIDNAVHPITLEDHNGAALAAASLINNNFTLNEKYNRAGSRYNNLHSVIDTLYFYLSHTDSRIS